MFHYRKIRLFSIVLFMTALSITFAQEQYIQGLSIKDIELPVQPVMCSINDFERPFSIDQQFKNSLIHARYSTYYMNATPVDMNIVNDDLAKYIRQESKPKRFASYYISSSDENVDYIEPYTLYTLLYHQNHSIITSSEGCKYQFYVYSLLDNGITNIASRSVKIWWDDNGKYHECPTEPGYLIGLEKPTEEQWKNLRMRLMFIFLMDQKLGNINDQLTNSKRK